jgi:hypothetical protein
MPPGDDAAEAEVVEAMAEEGVFAIAKAIDDAVKVWKEVKTEEAILYEKRTAMIEKMAMALEHYNEQKFHSVL